MKYQREEQYFNSDFQNGESEICDPQFRVDQVFGEMVIQEKMAIIYCEKDSQSALSVRM